LLALDIVRGHILHRYRRAIHPHGRQHVLASFHCGNSSCTWFYTMAALVGLQSRCQIDMRCAHRLWAQTGSLRTGSRPFIGRRDWLAQGVYRRPPHSHWGGDPMIGPWGSGSRQTLHGLTRIAATGGERAQRPGRGAGAPSIHPEQLQSAQDQGASRCRSLQAWPVLFLCVFRALPINSGLGLYARWWTRSAPARE